MPLAAALSKDMQSVRMCGTNGLSVTRVRKGPGFSSSSRAAPMGRSAVSVSKEGALVHDDNGETSGAELLPLAMQHGSVKVPSGFIGVGIVGWVKQPREGAFGLGRRRR